MGKTSNCLKMLQILSSGRVYKGQELADILETNVRNIAEYRTELEMALLYRGYPRQIRRIPSDNAERDSYGKAQ